MKRILPAIAALALVATLFSSCAHTTCPAYGKHGSVDAKQEKRF